MSQEDGSPERPADGAGRDGDGGDGHAGEASPTPSQDRPARESQAPSSFGAAIARARPKDRPGAFVARWRVAAGLFGSSEATGVGRFQLRERLGVGGMGVIYAAYDPELERTVAVKLIHLVGPDGTALAEAKALARLSHPNVVTVFDYGVADECLYIVMELVHGQTLRLWVKGRSRREILKAYRQAGEALAAAHAAALVHRDFKPDNAIMGLDGRVRVVDFGLACEAADPIRADQIIHGAAGTPGYMAPEQLRGEAVTAVTDQYGFCTALDEALQQRTDRSRATATVRWVQAVLERGRSVDPGARFPSMRALLDALDRDPSATRRRWLAVGGLATAGLVAFASGRASSNIDVRACDEGEARLAATWSDESRAAALHRLEGLSPYGRSLRPRLQNDLSEHTRRWAAGYRDACLARARGLQSIALTDRRLACLENGRSALRAVAEIVRTTEASDLASVVPSVRAIPDPDTCSDLKALLVNDESPSADEAPRVSALRSRLQEARVQIAAGRSGQARPLAEETVLAARALSYGPLLAEALLVQGHAVMNTEDRPGAIAILTESFTKALESGRTSLAVEAWARRAWAHGTSLGGVEALSGLEVIEALAENRATSQFARALFHNNVGCVEMGLERRDRARTAFERASRDALGFFGPGAAELLNVDVNLGMVTDDPARRDDILERAFRAQARLLGEDHPETLATGAERGLMSVRFDRALELMTPNCSRLEPNGEIQATRCWLEVGFIRGELSDQSGAVTAMARATAARRGGPPVPLAAPYVELWQGNAQAAAGRFRAALAALPFEPREPWWDRLERAELELGLGRALRLAGSLGPARKVLQTSLARLEAIAGKVPSPSTERRLTRARAELAKVSSAVRAPERTTAGLARAAATGLRQEGGGALELAELERLAARAPAGP